MVQVTLSVSPTSGSTVTGGGTITITGSVTDPGETYIFQPQGNNWANGSACYVQLSINGVAQGFADPYTSTTNIYNADYGGNLTPHVASGYNIVDGIRGASSGTLTVTPTSPWPANASLVLQIHVRARGQSSGSTVSAASPGGGWTFTVQPNIQATTTSSAENTALAGDLPFLMGNNLIENYVTLPAWSQGISTWNSYTDVTDPVLPTRRLFDRQGSIPSGPVLASVGSYTLLMSVTYSPLSDGLHSFDTLCILGHNFGTCTPNTTSITLQLADSPDFVTNSYTPVTITGITTNSRILVTNLGGSHQRFYGVTYVRLIVNTGSGNFTAAPVIGEIILGRRRQLSYFPDVPFEDKGSESDVVDFVALSGTRARYVRSYGRRRLDWTLRSAGVDKNGLNQENEVRSWWRECNHGSKPSVVVLRPQSSPMPLYMYPDPPTLDMPIYGPYERAFHMTLTETTPYWQVEQAQANVYPV